jgi:hypothetical protein
MLCPSCHSTRPADYEPCPLCYAPSPLTGGTLNGNYTTNYTPQFMMPLSVQETALASQEQQTARLPVPYTDQTSMPVPVVRTVDFPTIHTGEDAALVPVAPEEHPPIHVPPMYTKPRPLIPRYRVISGVISFFVVLGLLCGGSLYFAQVTGRLAFVEQLINPQFQNLPPSPVATLPLPATPVVYNTKDPVITSATTALSIDSNGQPTQPTDRFVVGKPIYVTYSVHAKTAGTVTFAWFTGNNFFEQSMPQHIPAPKNGTSYTADISAIYYRSAEGKVELMWNGVLQVTLYFVVEPQ